MEDSKRNQIIEIWKTIVEVQQHFNDIGMRIRSMFVTILLALFAAVGFLLNQDLSLNFLGYNIQFATLMPIFGMFGTFLFYFIDRYWYHRLLVGSVIHAIKIETKYKDEIPELSLSKTIGDESPYKPRGIVLFLANLLVSHDKYRSTRLLHSDGKIELFYKSVILVLFVLTIILGFLGGITIDKSTPMDTGNSMPSAQTVPAPSVSSSPEEQ